ESRAALLADLTRQGDNAVHLPLIGLDEDEVLVLLKAELADFGATTRSAMDLPGWVSSASGGNPLFVVELARQLRDLAPAPEPNQWSEVPSGLREVVSHRISHLPEETRSMLSLAATIGKEF